jgi:hypothetical protein
MSRYYSDIMHYLIESSCISVFALVDGLQYERYYGKALQEESGIAIPLFNTWPDSQIAFAGPWLVHLNRAMRYYEELKTLELAFPSVSWIASSSTLEQLVIHFHQYLNVALPDGNVGLLRFWDPRVADRLVTLLDAHQHRDLMKGVEEWLYYLKGQVCSLKWRETA